MKNIRGLALGLALLPVSALFAQTPQYGNSFTQTNLVADSDDFNPQIVNPYMLDAWGIALRPPGAGGHIWVNAAEDGQSFEYIGDVGGVALYQDGLTAVTIDQPQFTDHGYSFVTGQSYNAAKDIAGQPVEFPVPSGYPADNDSVPGNPVPIQGGTSGSSAFVFCTEDGCINCWRSNTETAMTDAPIMINYSKTSSYFPYHHNSVFSGCTLTTNASTSAAYAAQGGNHLFATDFDNNVIEVFDHAWNDVTQNAAYKNAFQPPTSVTTSTVPNLHVFNIQDIAGHLYVTWASFNEAGDEGMENVNNPGYGHMTEYNEDGSLALDFNDQGMLNAPWGIAIAPATFGKFGGDVLVANFGDGTIAAFDPNTGQFIDQLRDGLGNAISIDGIWGLTFGNGVSLGDANSLYFTAGPNSEYDGLFGKLTFTPVGTDTPVMPALALLVMGAALFGIGVVLWPARRAGCD